MNPDSLRVMGDDAASRRLSPMEVHAHADAWQSDRRANAALRERLIEAGEAMRQALSDLEWVERQSPGSNFQASILLLRKRIASLPESISLSPDGPTDHLGETEDKP